MFGLRKHFIFLLTVLTASIFLAGCGVLQGKSGTEQVLTYNLAVDPETLDPALSTGVIEQTVENALFEGLVRLDAKGQPAPGMAERWEVSADGLKYTFYLREGRWSNGDPVTAEDFVYAWRRVLAPETGSSYSYQLYCLKNARQFNEGKIKNPGLVGVKALSGKVLAVELEQPTPYFLSLTGFPTLFPVHRETVEKNKAAWASLPDTLVGNGPFKLAAWEHNSKITLVKNPDYWDHGAVKLDRIVMTMVDNPNTGLTMFENGQIDMGDNLPAGELERLVQEGKAKIGPDLSVDYFMFNLKRKPFADQKVRKALALAIDRSVIAGEIKQGAAVPALAFVPPGVADAGGEADFRKTGGDYFKDNDVESARLLLAGAGYPGGKGFPRIELLTTSNQSVKMVTQAVAEMWRKNLGVNVVIREQEWKAYLDSLDRGDFQVAWVGWNGDYNDPMTFLDLWLSNSPYNQGKWVNQKYDELINNARNTGDNQRRMADMHLAEQILLEEMPVAPLFFPMRPYLEKSYVKNAIHPNFAFDVEFKWAYIAK
ncbi:MAG: peptide ABC transporter substrate-binding protein [Peptococcaceae bacterium]|nr:MAG: peptide ABC transporter substrate-binding protein [Peptococcaceae bacterium]